MNKMSIARVRCGKCYELLYDPLVGEHYLEMKNDYHGNCPRCGTKYYLPHIIENSMEDE